MGGTEREYIAHRYRVEKGLGRGGMAVVYQAFDEATNKRVALKLLSQEASKSEHLSAMFEREFHTLVQLAHPRIIEVYDFGVDKAGAYYTMELLDGADLRKLAPLYWKEACKLLRDVASSLALLHSRRFLHRDISSRNVRSTKDGRAKLIDFGAMAPFGTPAKVIGTPAFIAPEALNHQPLDQRADLYSLGALAYWLMTKRYAYRASRMSELKDAWRTQPWPLSALNPEVPKALNDLVMSLLSLDRMARPFCASEVVETLGACAGLERDDTQEVKQAYLTAPQLVGRGELVTELRKRMLATLGGKCGDTLLFEGPSGIGRSRLLAELVLEGKVVGATVLTSGADTAGRGTYGVAWELIEQLFEHLYDLAVEAVMPHVETLSAVHPGLLNLISSRAQYRTQDALGFTTLSSEADFSTDFHTIPQAAVNVTSLPGPANELDDQAQSRPRIQKALLDIFLTISRSRSLVIAIDDFTRVDEPSMALLSALALQSREHALFLAVTAESDTSSTTQAAYVLLSRTARLVNLEPLDLSATEALLRSIFGDAPNVGLLADRVYGVSKGNPRAVMQLAQHLMDRGLLKYQAGTWMLPASIDAGDLPNSLNEALKAKLRQLSAGAIEIARTMALSADQRFSLEECLALARGRDGARLTRELNELVESGVLVSDGQYFSLGQPGWVGVLTEGLDQASERAGHLRLVDVFSRRGGEQFRVVHHMFGSGQTERGLDVLLEHIENAFKRFETNRFAFSDYIQSRPQGWINTCRYALELCKRLGRPEKQVFILRRFFVRSRFISGTETRNHVIKVLDQLYHDSGLDIYQALGEERDAQVRIGRALELAQQRFDATAESERVLAPLESIHRLSEAILDALDIIALNYDYELLAHLPSVEPFFPLSPALHLVEDDSQASRCLVAARFERARQLFSGMLSRLDDSGLTESYREYIRLGIIYTIGLLEASIGVASALTRADEIEPNPLLQINAWRIRMIYYLRQGDTQKAEQCSKFLELLQIQNTPRQFYEGTQLLPVILAYASYDDLSGVTQTIDDLEGMAERHSGWIPVLHYARGEHHRIGGDFSGALVEFEKALALTAVGRHPVWPYAAGAHLRALFEVNRLEEAKKLGFARLEDSEKANLGYVREFIAMPLALIEAKLGEKQSAERLADAAIERWKSLGATGVYVGIAYETRARVAIYLNDPERFNTYYKLCGEQYRVGHNAALTAKYQKLLRDARHANIVESQKFAQASELIVSLSEGGDVVDGVRTRLAGRGSYRELVDGALDLIIECTGSREGYLYLFEAGELTLVSKKGGEPPNEKTVRAAGQMLTNYTEEKSKAQTTEMHTGTTIDQSLLSELQAFESVVLPATVRGKTRPVGAALLRSTAGSQLPPNDRFFEAIALCLYEGSGGKS